MRRVPDRGGGTTPASFGRGRCSPAGEANLVAGAGAWGRGEDGSGGGAGCRGPRAPLGSFRFRFVQFVGGGAAPEPLRPGTPRVNPKAPQAPGRTDRTCHREADVERERESKTP
jgi:hypothetical protein